MFLESLIVAISTPIYAALIGLEILLSNWQQKRFYSFSDVVTNTCLMLMNMGLDVLFRVVYVLILVGFYQFRFFDWEPGILYWSFLFFAEDFAFYWLHRVDHHCRVFWAVHVTHHSSEYFNLTTGFRSSVFQPLYRFIYFIPIVLIGFRVEDIILMYSITQIYGIIVHTELVDKLGFLEHFLITPSHHRVHHASNIRYLDKNLGMVLIVWDKLFGTFQEELKEDPVVYGITEKKLKKDLVNVVFHEWKNIALDLKREVPFSVKMKYLFLPPGWSHDGSGKTTRELREEAMESD